MKKTLLLLLCGWALVAGAQQVTVTSTTPLLRGIEPAFYPTLSPSGDRLLYSDVDARGLKMLDLGTQAVTTISEQTGAGFDAKWSNDGQVYYITSKVDEKSRLVFRTGMRYDLKRQASDVVLEAQHGAVHLETGTQGMAIKGAVSAAKKTDANVLSKVVAQVLPDVLGELVVQLALLYHGAYGPGGDGVDEQTKLLVHLRGYGTVAPEYQGLLQGTGVFGILQHVPKVASRHLSTP